MSRERRRSGQDAFQELHLDSGSDSDDFDDDSSNFEPDSSESDSERPSTSAATRSRSPIASRLRSSRSRSRSVRGGRGRRSSATGGRGSIQDDSDDDDGWIEVEYGQIDDVPAFTGQQGIKVPVPGDQTPKDYFELFINDFVVDLMVTETNKYADQAKLAAPNDYYVKLWNSTNRVEMKKFIGLLMAMGIIDKPELRQFWSTHPILETPFFPKIMPRDRFLAILTFWHLADNTQTSAASQDKIFKIRKLFDHLCDRFQECYSPGQNLSVDESIMPWRGRLSFRQFIPKKPIRYGLKLYCCCESKTGYISSMKLYTGKEGGAVEHGHGPNVVKYVTRDFMQLGHTIYMDSFFSSVALFQELLQAGTTACGTVLRHRRGNPPSLKSKTLKLEKGQGAVRQKGKIVAMRYNDRKDCMLISTIHNAAPVPTGKKKRDREGREVEIVRPSMVHMYNMNMGGVDSLDQNLSYYAFNRKTMKWWKRAATHLLHIAKVQAHILFRIAGKSLSQLDFTLQLIMELVDAAPSQRPPTPLGLPQPSPRSAGSSPRPSTSAEEEQPSQLPEAGEPSSEEPPRKRKKVPSPMPQERLDVPRFKHYLEEIPPTEKKPKPTKICVCCTVYNKRTKQYSHRKESRYQCMKCGVALCVNPCHMVYHSVRDYQREMRRRLHMPDPEEIGEV